MPSHAVQSLWCQRAPAKQKAHELGEQAGHAAGEAATQIKETAAVLTESVTEVLRDASDTARDRVTRLADDAVSVSDRASARMRAAIPDREDRDNYLLGAAAPPQYWLARSILVPRRQCAILSGRSRHQGWLRRRRLKIGTEAERHWRLHLL